MLQVRVRHSLSAAERAQVAAFLDDAHRHEGTRLNDHLLGDLAAGAHGPLFAVLATKHDQLVGYAQASCANDGLVVGCVVRDGAEPGQEALLRALLNDLPADTAVVWWATEAQGPIAARLGMTPDRRLSRMTRPLPIEQSTDITVRAFRVGTDDDAWLAVNNAAFAWHGEQGGWNRQMLRQRQGEPWFDASGFLLHERDGRLAAFCWTKLHAGPTLVGEIYVIAVHPDFHGHGLGRALTIAGLQHLQAVGATSAMLYVDADNTAAVGLYRTLGFHVDHVDQSYLRAPRGAIT
ncbi:MAG: mycothiol synthase [Ilumatobacteraceae bacterium]